MQFLWAKGPSTAEEVRESLLSSHPMKDATARTILRRLEAKGYATHREEGRTYVYSALEQPENAGMRALKQILDRFWGGSPRALVAGMLEHEVIDPAELKEISEKLDGK
jgi:BlaI family penicillinase repressor